MYSVYLVHAKGPLFCALSNTCKRIIGSRFKEISIMIKTSLLRAYSSNIWWFSLLHNTDQEFN